MPELEERLDALKTLLASEPKDQAEAEAEVPTAPTKPMEDFIKGVLRRRKRSKADIGEALKKNGYIQPNQYAGRVAHAKLMHMANSKIVREDGDGLFELVEEAENDNARGG